MAHGVKLVVWDFDKTILRIHAFGDRIAPADVSKRDLDADFCDRAFFVQLSRFLVARGVAVAVASFGKYDVIQEYLDRAFACGAYARVAEVPADHDCTPWGGFCCAGGASAVSSAAPTPLAQSASSLGSSCIGTQTSEPSASEPSTPLPPTFVPSDTGSPTPSGPPLPPEGTRIFDKSNIITPTRVGGKEGWTMEDGKNSMIACLLAQMGSNGGAGEAGISSGAEAPGLGAGSSASVASGCGVASVDPRKVLFFDGELLALQSRVFAAGLRTLLPRTRPSSHPASHSPAVLRLPADQEDNIDRALAAGYPHSFWCATGFTNVTWGQACLALDSAAAAAEAGGAGARAGAAVMQVSRSSSSGASLQAFLRATSARLSSSSSGSGGSQDVTDAGMYLNASGGSRGIGGAGASRASALSVGSNSRETPTAGQGPSGMTPRATSSGLSFVGITQLSLVSRGSSSTGTGPSSLVQASPTDSEAPTSSGESLSGAGITSRGPPVAWAISDDQGATPRV